MYTPTEAHQICELHQAIPLSELDCHLCSTLVKQPVQLVTCGRMVCCECLCGWLEQHNNLVCPSCATLHLEDFTTIQQVPPLVVSMLGGLCVVCLKCNRHVRMRDFSDHTSNRCTPCSEVKPSSSIEDVLHQPLNTPLTPIEEKMQTCLARRSMTSCRDDGTVLELKTGGEGCPLMYKNIIILLLATHLCACEMSNCAQWQSSSKNCSGTQQIPC